MCCQVTALRSLGLNIRKAKMKGNVNEFYLTESSTSEKIVVRGWKQVARRNISYIFWACMGRSRARPCGAQESPRAQQDTLLQLVCLPRSDAHAMPC